MFVNGYGKGNNVIETFDEFRYFTGLTYINGDAFGWCSNLKKITLPSSIIWIKQGAFRGTAIEELIINEGCEVCDDNIIDGNKSCILIDFPSTITSIGTRPANNGGKELVVICRAIVPPTFSGSWGYTNAGKPIAIYVPDASVLIYKSATGWSESASLIQPLSMYEKDY